MAGGGAHPCRLWPGGVGVGTAPSGTGYRPGPVTVGVMAPAAPTGTRRFPFRFEPAMAPFSTLFGVRPATAWVEVRPAELAARFGPWSMRTPWANITSATATGPYSWIKVVGPVRLSFSDRGATFATTRVAGVCLEFASPLPIALPGALVRSPNLTVTVADTQGLVDAIRAHIGV